MAPALALTLALSAMLPAAPALHVKGPSDSLLGAEADGLPPQLCGLPENEKPKAVMQGQVSSVTQARLFFVVHRKTGFILTGRLASCINHAEGGEAAKSVIFSGNESWELEGRSEAQYVHMARDAIDLMLSSYLYDKITSKEPGTLGAGTAMKFKRRVQRQLFWMGLAESKFVDKSNRKYQPGNESDFMELKDESESLREFLVRVPPEVGIRTTLGYSWNRLESVRIGREKCRERKDACTEVYLDELMSSSEAFTSTVQQILDSAGIEETPALMACIAEQDTHSKAFAESHYAKHCSTQDVTPEERQHYRDLLIKVDTEYYNGYFQDLAAEWKAERP